MLQQSIIVFLGVLLVLYLPRHLTAAIMAFLFGLAIDVEAFTWSRLLEREIVPGVVACLLALGTWLTLSAVRRKWKLDSRVKSCAVLLGDDKVAVLEQKLPVSCSDSWSMAGVSNGLTVWSSQDDMLLVDGEIYAMATCVHSPAKAILSYLRRTDIEVVDGNGIFKCHLVDESDDLGESGCDRVTCDLCQRGWFAQALGYVAKTRQFVLDRHWYDGDDANSTPSGPLWLMCQVDHQVPTTSFIWKTFFLQPLSRDVTLLTLVVAPSSNKPDPGQVDGWSAEICRLRDHSATSFSVRSSSGQGSPTSEEVHSGQQHSVQQSGGGGGGVGDMPVQTAASEDDQKHTHDKLPVQAAHGSAKQSEDDAAAGSAATNQNGASDDDSSDDDASEQDNKAKSAADILRDCTNEQRGHLAVLESAYDSLWQCSQAKPGQDGWQKVTLSKGVTVMKKVSAGKQTSSLSCVKGSAVIRAPIPLLLDWMTSDDKVKQWDEFFSEGKLVEDIGGVAKVENLIYKGVWPTTPRDFCVVSGVKTLDNGVVLACSKSVTHPRCVPTSSHVRAECLDGGFAICPIAGTEGSYTVTYVTRVDLKGNIPSMVVNRINQDSPMSVAVLRDKVQPLRLGFLRNLQKKKAEEARVKAERKQLRRSKRRQTASLACNGDAGSGASVSSMSTQSAATTTATAGVVNIDSGVRGNVAAAAPLAAAAAAAATAVEVVGNGSSDESVSASRATGTPSATVSTPNPPAAELIPLKTIANQAAASLLAEVVLTSDMDAESDFRSAVHNGWRFDSMEKHVSIFRKQHSVPKECIFMGRGLIKYPVSTVWQAVRNTQTRLACDYLVTEMKTVACIDEHTNIVSIALDKEKCMSKVPMDLCCVVTERTDNKYHALVSQSVDFKKCPVRQGFERAQLSSSGWCLQAHVDVSSGVPIQATMVTYICQLNLKSQVSSDLLAYLCRRQTLAVSKLGQHCASLS
ncbi:uncharacterized protein LOC135826448 [Sycon ciliatum]|uniref:uncharacterized protein LOC135826448 n=1 Tax=Sycon ciliatum TaxID=27933 RepID=UPI0031F6B671